MAKRKRPPSSENGARKVRAWRGMTPGGGVVKQEPMEEGREDQQEEGEFRQEGDGVGDDAGDSMAMEAVEEEPEPQISLTFGVSLFQCRACNLPLKPPTFKCEAGHVVCFACRNSHGQECGGVVAYTPCFDVDAFVRGAKQPCAFEEFGCPSVVVYHEAADHRRLCGWAPCFCPCPGCAFSSSPPRLLSHFAAAHSWPVTEVSYGKPYVLPLPQGWHALVGVDDRSVFLLSGGMFAAGAAVSLVCVRANGDAPEGVTHYECKLWAEAESNSMNMTMMTSEVASCNLSGGFPTPDPGMFLAVPLNILHDVSGNPPVMKIRIDKIGAAAARSATSTKRNYRRPH